MQQNCLPVLGIVAQHLSGLNKMMVKTAITNLTAYMASHAALKSTESALLRENCGVFIASKCGKSNRLLQINNALCFPDRLIGRVVQESVNNAPGAAKIGKELG